MNYFKKTVLAITTLALFQSSSYAQEGEVIEVRDFETWTKAGVNLKLNKKWTFGLEQQLRLDSNSTTVDVYFTEINARYKMNSGLYLGGGFRFIRENDNEGKIQGYETHLRYNFDLGYKHSIDRLKLGYRLRYQSKNETESTAGIDGSPNKTLRLKVGGEYNIKGWKFDPKLSFEVFNRFADGDEGGLSKFRATLGTSYNLKKWGEISGFYRIERELNPTYANYPKTTHIVGLSYTYTFKIKTNEK